MWRLRYRQSIDIMTRVGEVFSNFRGAGRRRLVGLPAMVHTKSEQGVGGSAATRMFILEDMSKTGARLIGDSTIAPGTTVTFNVPGSSVSGTGVVRHVQSLQTSLAILFSIGVEFEGRRKRWSLSGFGKANDGDSTVAGTIIAPGATKPQDSVISS